jgi:hypothetical protein
MANFRGPFFVKISSHSEFGPHVQQIPTTDYTGPSLVFPFGVFTGWDLTLADADVMIVALVDKMAKFFPAAYTFDNWQVFSQPTPADPAIPLAGNTFTAKVGTSVASGWDKATQATITWRSTTFGKSKLVFLDYSSGGDFSKIATLPGSGDLFDLDAEFTNVSNGWKAQDNGRPQTFISMTATLNEKLRRAYRLT